MDIKRLVKKDVVGLRAYSAKEIPCRVKLDANESPYGFAPAIREALSVATNRYPDPEAKNLKKILARNLKVDPSCILQGNGSDELIYYLIATFGGPVLFPTPTFSMYGIIAQALGEKRIALPLDADFDLDMKPLLDAIRKDRPRLVFLSSPNNPTGNCYSTDSILKVIEASRGIVVVDEAYQPFSSEMGFLPFLDDYPNLVIMRTLSKIGLAALRFGYMIASSDIIGNVNKVRLPFNVNALSQSVAISALKEKGRMRNSIRKIIAERERLFRDLVKIKGVKTFPSEANFILFRVNNPDRVYSSLLKKGVLIRNVNEAVAGCLRVTVGTPSENEAFIRVLRSSVK